MAKAAAKKNSLKRTTLTSSGTDARFYRDDEGKIGESDDVGKSLSKDAEQKARTKVKPGQGDKGDGVPKKSSFKKKPQQIRANKKNNGELPQVSKLYNTLPLFITPSSVPVHDNGDDFLNVLPFLQNELIFNL